MQKIAWRIQCLLALPVRERDEDVVFLHFPTILRNVHQVCVVVTNHELIFWELHRTFSIVLLI